MLKRIHVNQHVIRANQRKGTEFPPITVKTYRQNIKAHEVAIDGPSRLVYSPERPLACGARLWIETTASIVIRNGNDQTEVS
jgi:hypothetical protein